MGRRGEGHPTTLVPAILSEASLSLHSPMSGSRRDLLKHVPTKEIGAKVMVLIFIMCHLYNNCVPIDVGVACGESSCDLPYPSEAAVMEQQMTYTDPEYSIDWEEVKKGKAAGMPGKWVSM